MDDLVTWLRAQLDEDERVARTHGHLVVLARLDAVDRRWDPPAVTTHAEVWTAGRALAEVEAKRRILDLVDLHFDDETGRAVTLGGYGEAYWDIVRLLALPYADLPGYDEGWRP